MKNILLAIILATSSIFIKAQVKVQTPDLIYSRLFTDVQMSSLFPDNKTFVDCVPKRKPEDIVADYLTLKNNPAVKFSLKEFILANFHLPTAPSEVNHSQWEKDITKHIKNLWAFLIREQDKTLEGSSLLALPKPYIVPGGRFREIYYWDSYFTMLGLKESGEKETMKNMVDNFAYLIHTYGHIPNGNRSYYLSRSQPPFFALMVELLASVNGDSTYTHYLPALEKEYRYWTNFKADNGASKWVIATNGTKLFRYCDSLSVPRQESYKEDSTLLAKLLSGNNPLLSKNKWVQFRLRENKKPGQLYKHLRSGAESGWDFSSRWLADGQHMETIQTTVISPVDLNCLIYKLQMVLAKAYDVSGDKKKRDMFTALAKELAERGIQRYFFNSTSGWFMDYNISNNKQGTVPTLAGMFPLFMKIATKEQATKAAAYLKKNFLKPGGVVTTLKNTGQQWDAPNGWAPLQWITIIGLENYGHTELAKTIAERWIKLNYDVYTRTGKLMEKYNVIDTHLEAGGGEYPGQDGFGWTNGVLSALIAKYGKPAVADNSKPKK